MQASGAETSNFSAASNTQSVTIGQATPTITWSNPADISYGTALGATQLNATATPAGGSFSFTPAKGVALGAGTGQTLSVTYTPADPNYAPATKTVTINVSKATPYITAWPIASAIIVGQPLAYSTLSGGAANVVGKFDWTTPTTQLTSIGTANQSVTFTPTDTNNFNSVNGSASVTVRSYEISASVSGGNGTITPASKGVMPGDSQTLTIAPAAGYLPLSLFDTSSDVTGSLVAQANGTYTYTLTNVTADHSISVSFGAVMSVTAKVAGSNGTIAPTQANVPASGSSTIILRPATGYMIDTIVDSADSGTLTDNGDGSFTYTLTNITSNRAVKVKFKADLSQSGQSLTTAEVMPASNVGVTIGNDASFVFDTITNAGNVTVNAITPVSLPANFSIGYQPISSALYEITTPPFTGNATVCLTYNINDLTIPANESQLQLFHYNTGTSTWENLHAIVDTTAKTICGVTTSFSPFVVAEITTTGPSTASYTVTPFVAGGKGGSITPNTPQTVTGGGSISFQFNPDPGYKLAFITVGAVTVSPTATSYTFDNISADVNVTATFVPDYHAITAIVTTVPGTSTGGKVGTTSTLVLDGNDYFLNVWPAHGYTVTANLDGADVTAQVIANGGYQFTGVTADHNLAVTFTANPTYTITTSAGTGGSISPSGPVQLLGSTSQTFSITPAAGYAIQNVTVGGNSIGTASNYTFANVQADGSISATFTDHFTVTTSATNGSITPGGTVGVGGSFPINLATSRQYKLNRLLVNGNDVTTNVTNGNYTISNIMADQTVQASFTPVYWTLSASAGPGGSVGTTSTLVMDGGSYLVSVTSKPGYMVTGALLDGTTDVTAQVKNNAGYQFTDVTADHTLTVTFAAIPAYAVTAAVTGGNGTITPAGTTDVVSGSNQTYSFTPNAGYAIGTVSVDGTPVGAPGFYTFTNVTGPHTISVTFANAVTLTTSASNGSISVNGTLSTGTVSVGTGTSPVLTVTPNAHYKLYRLMVGSSNVTTKVVSDSYTINNIAANTSVSASFTPIYWTLTGSAGANGKIGVSSTQVMDGNNYFVSITPNSGYKIASVTDNGTDVTSQLSGGGFTVTNMTMSHAISATFVTK
ncbi:beta strand repeat-containing protein [Geomonas agri]|uniref:beta strand repeat-containing protein n=1 Tax=Geomonas agri TaxID=2873702 RepID=UPI001CD6A495|nr:hypothetical protein [Geomonas agri]